MVLPCRKRKSFPQAPFGPFDATFSMGVCSVGEKFSIFELVSPLRGFCMRCFFLEALASSYIMSPLGG
jgi:hypothetical protein